MPCKKDIAVVRTIGIDTGKNTLHMIGLDGKGMIVQREKFSRSRIAARLVNVPPYLIGSFRRTQSEQMSSGLPLRTDLARRSRHVANVPKHKVAALQPAARGKSREAGSQLRGQRWRV
jgi:hypothetical protein